MGEYAAVTDAPEPSPQPDWRRALLAGSEVLPTPEGGRPSSWPGYSPRRSVTVHLLPGARAVAAAWDFAVFGGSFGEDDATALVEAVRQARARRLPLVTLVRSGGTRLQEGMAALVGIPRARLALLALAADGLPHLSVADAPTTGGVWISVSSAADLRVAVEGATVGFAGPRVVQAVTGTLPAPGSHTAASAHAAGLVDAVLPAGEVAGWLDAALLALTAAPQPSRSCRPRCGPSRSTAGSRCSAPGAAPPPGPRSWPACSPTGSACGPGAATRASRPVSAGSPGVPWWLWRWPPSWADVRRRTATGWPPAPTGWPVGWACRWSPSSTPPGPSPAPAAEEDGIAPAMGEALDALLTCPTPTLALVHGEGGSGGALAASACDVVLCTPDSYFAAIGPEGASAALRRSPQECADLLRLTPADLLALGAVDAVVAGPAASPRTWPACSRSPPSSGSCSGSAAGRPRCPGGCPPEPTAGCARNQQMP